MMPSATLTLQREWQNDAVAIAYLKERGYVLTRRWEWIKPKGHAPTKKELRAIDYMFQEWDFGGIALMTASETPMAEAAPMRDKPPVPPFGYVLSHYDDEIEKWIFMRNPIAWSC